MIIGWFQLRTGSIVDGLSTDRRPAMRTLFAGLCIAAALAGTAAAETRCGWIVNPTPANWWLADSQAEWIISTQGGEQADGMDLMPDFTEGEWVVTNGSSYGYGCACMNVVTADGRITRIKSVRQLRLRKCRADRKLPPIR
jgi:Protein of unknown function (DUF4087)